MKEGRILRVASVGYLNSAPYRGLRGNRLFEFGEFPPAECARRLHEGEADLALLPVAEGFLSGEYSFFHFGIVAPRAVESVLLLSSEPFEATTAVALDTSSRASVLLFRLLLALEAFPFPKEVSLSRVAPTELRQELKAGRTVLVIGDLALELRREFPYVLDLAEVWQQQTSLPFVFAAWAFRKDSLSPEEQATIEAGFERSLSHAEIHARVWADKHGIDRAEAMRYITEVIRYRIDGDALAGLRRFQDLASAHRLLPRGELIIEPGIASPEVESRPSIIVIPKKGWEQILEDRLAGGRLTVDDALTLETHAPSEDLLLAASSVSAPFIAKRTHQLQTTNVCARRFLNWPEYHAPGQEQGFVLSVEDATARWEMYARGADLEEGDVLWIKSGVAPECTSDYFRALFTSCKRVAETTRLCALSPQELKELSVGGPPQLNDQLVSFREHGLEILADGTFAPLLGKYAARVSGLLSVDEWMAIRRAAWSLGIASRCTLGIGLGESSRERVLQLAKMRLLQDETVSLESVWCVCGPHPPPLLTFVRQVAIAKLFLDNVQTIEVSHPLWNRMSQIFAAPQIQVESTTSDAKKSAK